MPENLQVSMLGGFTVRWGQRSVDDSSNRTRKVWLLLAYLIYNRRVHTTQEQLLSLIGGSDAQEEDVSGRLKALLYRVRGQLNQLEEKAGHRMILHEKGRYTWNPEISVTLDVEEFDRLYNAAAAAQDSGSQLTLYLQALALYGGDFLPKLNMEPWVIPITAYYHQRYLQAAERALALLEQEARWEEAQKLCLRALELEPYREELYQHRMRCALALSDRTAAVAAYEKMSEMLFDNFGVMPSEESRQLYREATRESKEHAIAIGSVQEQLREVDKASGAVFCEFDFFRLLYQVQARALLRSGDVVHIALLTCQGEDGGALPRRSLDTAMENLQALLLKNLRQGDVVTRCSATQLCCMLPHANYENSCAVCQRIVKAFYRQYPHSPAKLHFRVHPLEPAQQDRG